MKAVYLVGAVQAFFLAILLLSKKKKIPADYILFVWLVITGIPLFLYYFNYEVYSYLLKNTGGSPSYLMFINIPVLLLQSPFLYIYVSTIVENRKKFTYGYIYHFIPAVLFLIAFSIIIGFEIEDKASFNIRSYKYFWILSGFFPLTLIMAIYYIVRSYGKLKKYRTKLYTQFSYTDQIDLLWLKVLIIIISSVWLVMIVLGAVIRQMHSLVSIHDIVLLSASLAIFVVGYFGFMRTDIFLFRESSLSDEYAKSSDKNETEEPDENTILEINELKKHMETEKPWLESKLSIKDLADQLHMQTYHLSNLINNHLDKNFFDFVNEYRVNEVKKQLKMNTRFTILAVAFDCGFNSKSSFNRIFKNYTGMTPSEFQKTL